MSNKKIVKYSPTSSNVNELISVELTDFEFKYCILFLLIAEAFYDKLLILQNPDLKRTHITGNELVLLIFLDKYLQNF